MSDDNNDPGVDDHGADLEDDGAGQQDLVVDDSSEPRADDTYGEESVDQEWAGNQGQG